MTVTFWLLSLSHLLNGDYCKGRCGKRIRFAFTKMCCLGQWKWTVLFYEAVNTFNTTTGIYFATSKIILVLLNEQDPKP